MTLLLYMFKIAILLPIKKRKPDTNPSIFITLTPTRKTHELFYILRILIGAWEVWSSDNLRKINLHRQIPKAVSTLGPIEPGLNSECISQRGLKKCFKLPDTCIFLHVFSYWKTGSLFKRMTAKRHTPHLQAGRHMSTVPNHSSHTLATR